VLEQCDPPPKLGQPRIVPLAAGTSKAGSTSPHQSACPPGRPRLLIADHDCNIVRLLSVSLRGNGFEVASASSAEQALAVAGRFRPDAMVLDIALPGIDIARTMRARHDRIPTLFLTNPAHAARTTTGLTIGGDDFVAKPFSLEEAHSRINSMLRRTSGIDDRAQNSTLGLGDLTLDQDSHEVIKAGQHVNLSATEFRLLRYFLHNTGRLLPKRQILQYVWPYDFRGDPNVVETYVAHLRRKIDTTRPRMLHTRRGLGYALRGIPSGGQQPS
jgi:two-component system, OmpR family, response regulator